MMGIGLFGSILPFPAYFIKKPSICMGLPDFINFKRIFTCFGIYDVI